MRLRRRTAPRERHSLTRPARAQERMTLYFSRHPEREPWASRPDAAARAAFVAALHAAKTRLFVQLVDAGGLRLRPGVARLVGEALAAGVPLAVCSTSNEQAVRGIVRLLGPAAEARIRVFAGDVVARKKPDPSVYLLAARELGVDPARCCVVEDSHIGLTAAKAAGMRCVVTTNGYTRDEDFGAADRVYDEIGDAGAERFSLADLAALAAQPVAGR